MSAAPQYKRLGQLAEHPHIGRSGNRRENAVTPGSAQSMAIAGFTGGPNPGADSPPSTSSRARWSPAKGAVLVHHARRITENASEPLAVGPGGSLLVVSEFYPAPVAHTNDLVTGERQPARTGDRVLAYQGRGFPIGGRFHSIGGCANQSAWPVCGSTHVVKS
jgi:hypothetical protein